MQKILGLRRPLALGAIGLGLAYGLLARFLFGLDEGGQWTAVMSASFIFGVPLVVGFVTVFASPPDDVARWGRWVTLPWASSLLVIVGALLLAWEGLICVVVWAPLFLVLASVGGFIGGAVRQQGGSAGRRGMVLASVAVLPFLASPLEQRTPAPVATHSVEDRIEIAASPEAVWNEIRAVAPIRPDELGPSFAHAIGFPKPIEARLVGTGVGAVRYATFERGVTFVETVTEWAPGRALAFTIRPESVPSRAFDEHVRVGGPYFDVLEGRYVIERLGPNRTLLRLSSRHRLSTRFNGYTRVWTDLFMRDIQQHILRVIQRRAETAAAQGPTR